MINQVFPSQELKKKEGGNVALKALLTQAEALGLPSKK